MKKYALYLGLVFMAAIVGCGGDSGGGSGSAGSSGNAPVVSNLQYSPHSTSLGSGGGAVTVLGTINFYDKDGDVKYLDITIQDANTLTVLNVLHETVSGSSGVTAGSINIAVVVNTTSSGSFIFIVSARDATNLHSNGLNGTFSVI